MKRSLIQKLGLLGVVSFLSYTAAVVFSPLAYPDYNWMAQAVSDLSAANAPSLTLWNQLSSFYNTCEVLCATIVCVGIQGRKTRLLRTGIYLFAVMEWVSAIGYRMFPLSSSGYAGTVQDVMHMAVTAAVVLLSIVSLITVIAAGAKKQKLPLLRNMRRNRTRNDAGRGAGGEYSTASVLRRCRALQRFRRDGLQHGAGDTSVPYGNGHRRERSL